MKTTIEYVASSRSCRHKKNRPATAATNIGVQLNRPWAEEKQTFNKAGDVQFNRCSYPIVVKLPYTIRFVIKVGKNAATSPTANTAFPTSKCPPAGPSLRFSTSR